MNARPYRTTRRDKTHVSEGAGGPPFPGDASAPDPTTERGCPIFAFFARVGHDAVAAVGFVMFAVPAQFKPNPIAPAVWFPPFATCEIRMGTPSYFDSKQ